jgi:hypothetical protein
MSGWLRRCEYRKATLRISNASVIDGGQELTLDGRLESDAPATGVTIQRAQTALNIDGYQRAALS